MALWAGSYLLAASGPETGHVDIGGTCIPASVSTVSTPKYSPSTHTHTHTLTHTHTARHFYPPLRDGWREEGMEKEDKLEVGGLCRA